jgi:ubiquinone biosynthesis protein
LLAKRGVELFFTQVFEHCLFHGDMHPGNIFVNINAPSSPRDPSFYAVDFGIMGTLGPNEQYYLAWNLWAFINRDYRKVAMLHIESGWVDPDTRVDVFEAAIRTVSEPILEKPLSEISFGQLLVNLFDVARSFNMQLQPQLLVFKKALINVEGIARQLDPELDLWSTARPHIEVWLKKQIGPVGLLKKIFGNMPTFQTFQTLSTALMDSPELSFKFFKVMGKQMFTKIFSKA